LRLLCLSFWSLSPSLASRLFVPLALLPLHMGSEERERERERVGEDACSICTCFACLLACVAWSVKGIPPHQPLSDPR
jgi:hypothetical protein